MISKINTSLVYIQKSLKPVSSKSDSTTKSMLLTFNKSDLDILNNLIKHIPANFRMEIGLDKIDLLLY